MTTLYSDLISIPGVALADALTTVVPKTTGQTWTANADPLFSTFVKYNYVTGLFTSSTADEAIGWCTVSAASGDTTATVALLPFVIYSGSFHGPSDTGQWSDPGNFYVQARSLCFEAPKLTTDAWVAGSFIYWSVPLQKAVLSSTDNVLIGLSAQAAGLGTATGIYYTTFGFRESFQFGGTNPHLHGTTSLPHRAGTTLLADTALAADINGDHFAASSTAAHGVIKRASTASPAASGDANLVATLYDSADTKIWATYKQFLIDAAKQQTVLIMPKLAAPEEIGNSSSQEVYNNSPSAPDDIDYIYIYKIQPYKLMRTVFFGTVNGSAANRIITPTDSIPPISLPISAALVWTAPSPDPSPNYSPPGPVDQSATHRLVFEGTWSIYKIEGNANTHDPGIYANKPRGNWTQHVSKPTINTSTGKCTTFLPTDYGKSAGQLYVIDPTRRFVHTYVYFENTTGPSAGSLRLDYSVYRTEADGSETVLRNWTTIPRNPWYTSAGLAYIRFDLDISLSDLGEAYPLMRFQVHYVIKYRQYHSTVSPYTTYTAQFGALGHSGLNEAGKAVSYGGRQSFYQRDHAYYYSVMPYRLMKSDGAEFTTDHIQAATYEFFTYDMTWAGSLSLSTTVVDADRVRIAIVSTLTPDTTATNLMSNTTGLTTIRVRRLSDGRFLHAFITQFSTPAGCKWSRNGAIGSLTYSASTLGSGLNSGYRVGYTSLGYWVDKSPLAVSEDYEVEVFTYGIGTFIDSAPRYFVRRDVLTLTI